MVATVGTNTYSDFSHAEEFLSNQAGSEEFHAEGEEVIDGFLVSSNQILEHYIQWKGEKADKDQQQQWPRVPGDDTTLDEDIYNGTTVPEFVRTAEREQALHLYRNPQVLDNSEYYNRTKVDNIELQDISQAPLISPLVNMILKDHMLAGTGYTLQRTGSTFERVKI